MPIYEKKAFICNTCDEYCISIRNFYNQEEPDTCLIQMDKVNWERIKETESYPREVIDIIHILVKSGLIK